MNSRQGARNRVLIVDNNEVVLSSLDKLLKDEGFDTRTTWSGHEALALMQSHPFDVLLVDDYIADLHVAEFLKRVKLQVKQPAVVVMQKGQPAPTDVRRYGSLGASAVVDKRDPEQVRRALAAGGWMEAPPKARVN
jgi:CheY-like chemotaxis protein